MSTKLDLHPKCLKELRKIAKKHPSVLDEFDKLGDKLKIDERPGDKIPNVGFDVYKVRLKNPSAQRGKSGGFRVVYYVQLVNSVVMLTIYSKTEQENISPEDIRQRIADILPSDEETPDD